jgi:fumarate reductase flavoprotein subunit
MQWMIKQMLVTWQHPGDALFADGAVLINRNGERFCDETISPEREIAVARQPGKEAYILLDARLAHRYSAWPHFISTAPEIAYAYVPDYLRLRSDVAIERETLKALASARGLPIDRLMSTVRALGWDQVGLDASENGSVRSGGTMFILLGPVRSYFTNAEGGVAVDTSLRVLDAAGKPIPGLYAAGQTGLGGMVLWAHGLHIAWAMTSGRLVGQTLGAPTA